MGRFVEHGNSGRLERFMVVVVGMMLDLIVN